MNNVETKGLDEGENEIQEEITQLQKNKLYGDNFQLSIKKLKAPIHVL